MRPAARLALWCARQTVDRQPRSPALAALTRTDWADFMRISQAHGILAVAWLALRPLGADVDEVAAAELKLAYEANTRRNLLMLGELRTILGALTQHGIRALAWKGPVLAHRAYGDIALRQFFDLDLLIRQTKVNAAQAVLESLGFRTDKAMTDHEQTAYVDHQGELELVRPRDGMWVELHSAVVPSYYARGLSGDDWWQRVVSVEVGRVEVEALDPIDEMHTLCVHGSKHRWNRLAWILDVAMLARVLTEEQWSEVLAAARDAGTLRMVRLGQLLAADLCGAAIPDRLLRAARDDRTAAALARTVARTLFDQRPSRFDALAFHARMRERSRDQLGYLVSVAFTPSGADWEALRLPRPLFPFYALTRPVRLAIKYGRRLVSPPHG